MAFVGAVWKAGRAVRIMRAQARAARLAPVISELQAQGIVSLYGIAKALNERGIPAARGGGWRIIQVKRVLARLELDCAQPGAR